MPAEHEMTSNSRVSQTQCAVCCIFTYRRPISSCTWFAIVSPWEAQFASVRIGSSMDSFLLREVIRGRSPRSEVMRKHSLSCSPHSQGRKTLTYFRWSFKDAAVGALLTKKSIHIIKRELKMIAKGCFH